MSRGIRAKGAARPVWRPTGAATNLVRGAVYPGGLAASRRELMARAGEVLLVLQFPVAELERVAFISLLERRLRRSYEGVSR